MTTKSKNKRVFYATKDWKNCNLDDIKTTVVLPSINFDFSKIAVYENIEPIPDIKLVDIEKSWEIVNKCNKASFIKDEN